MKTFNNIEVDSKIFNSEKRSAFIENIELAEKNLVLFNSKLKTTPITFSYKFYNDKPLFYTNPFSHFANFYLPLDWFIYANRNPQDHIFWIKLYTNRMLDNYYYRKDNIEESEYELFINIFSDYVPIIPSMSKEHKLILKNSIQDKVKIVKGLIR